MVSCSLLQAAGEVAGLHCLVLGASGGIGSLMTRTLQAAGARVYGVCSGRNAELVRNHGADEVLDYTVGPVGEQLLQRHLELDRVIDCIGGRDTERDVIRALRPRGAYLTICGPEPFVGERRLGWLRLLAMLAYIARRAVVSRLRGPRYRLIGPLAPDWAAMQRYLIEPNIRPGIDRVVPFERDAVREALAYVASHRARGKVVIDVGMDHVPSAQEHGEGA
jgi:NADPH:quinone reductase-like Zn-dependent oxidoreductase